MISDRLMFLARVQRKVLIAACLHSRRVLSGVFFMRLNSATLSLLPPLQVNTYAGIRRGNKDTQRGGVGDKRAVEGGTVKK